ncbi:MAG: hypothetical protein ACOH2T_19170 [Pseudomonas sp.]
MKPRKSWEPVYRYGGDRTSFHTPAPLGTANPYGAKLKAKKPKGKKK